MLKKLVLTLLCLVLTIPATSMAGENNSQNIPTVREQLDHWGMLNSLVIHNNYGSDDAGGIIFPGLFKWELFRKSYFNLKTRKGIKVPIPVSSKLIMKSLKRDNQTSGSPTYRLVFNEEWLNSHQQLPLSEMTKWLKKPNLVKVICHRYLLVNSGRYWQTIGVPLGVPYKDELPLAE